MHSIYKILILGVTGMLGHTLLRKLSPHFQVRGTVRNQEEIKHFFPEKYHTQIITGIDALQIDTVNKAITELKPDLVINCIGIIKQLKEAKNPILSISLNALFPHQLAQICTENSAKMLHISTDCVFDGQRGDYQETDFPNATDLYGRTKLLGEVHELENCLTLRTSIIGHELKGKFGLLEWFLAQEGNTKGFKNAIYTGFTTTEMAKIIISKIIGSPMLHGLYQVASWAINKYDLLKIIAKIYHKEIDIQPYEDFFCNRSLIGERFNNDTTYQSPTWEQMIKEMYVDWEEAKAEGFYTK
jgi:dTDP-4-dehydrorhamnose reductase